ncbi:MAG: UDP-2,3-diacylglucosamine diphosphatase [Bacteroidales bacterium]|nr:UDP-2,3-diacylglucosamine diphosphatase [Bacteroidales bacterium]
MDVRQGKYFFTADVHMGMSDDPHGVREQDFLDFLRSLPQDTQRLYLLGDVFDFWIDYKSVAPRGYVRILAALADLTDRGVQVFFYPGNHDWWVTDYFEKELGVKVVKEYCTVMELDGKTICLGHGDMPLAAKGKARLIFHLFHSKFWIAVLRAMPVRFIFWLARTWSASSRSKHRPDPDITTTGLYKFADKFGRDRAAAGEPPVDLYIFGHIHTPARAQIPSGGELLILGDWSAGPSYFCL